jgi:VIT1/CCC1 family predicted Fe2+/Mn2+ transporter
MSAPADAAVAWVMPATLVFLALLGAIGAGAGRASIPRAMLRVTFWGALAMAETTMIGSAWA